MFKHHSDTVCDHVCENPYKLNFYVENLWIIKSWVLHFTHLILSTPNAVQGCRRPEAQPKGLRAEARVHKSTHSHTMGNLVTPISLLCIALDCWQKNPQYLEETQQNGENMQKTTNTHRPEVGVRPQPWKCEATVMWKNKNIIIILLIKNNS